MEMSLRSTTPVPQPSDFSTTIELREAVAMAKEVRPVQLSPFLFCKRDGKGYFNETTSSAGWNLCGVASLAE
ncbi:hypothetical protein LPB67_02020 [Undibacterium sp. Jales W-56]|uniref:hypothetical protein n=1 Tax=Undibacterium sp. Jales W-56 TaxID=2897325 RepID=UPI0021D2B715|nr:hypothetical protein [Undibacterium sp. Jales W-56]MCU6432554.1 hypothetical protein [Undibacterium sp. Jales W-56]